MTAETSSHVYVVKETNGEYYAYQYVNGREQTIDLAEYLVKMVQNGYLAEIKKTICDSGREIATIAFRPAILKGIR